MGCKSIRAAYGIPNDVIVHKEDDDILLGFEFVPSVVRISENQNQLSIKFEVNPALTSTLNDILYAIQQTPAKFIEAMHAIDETTGDLVEVWTMEGVCAVKKYAESLDFPCITTDGQLMFENTHFLTKDALAEYTLRMYSSRVDRLSDQILKLESELAHLKSYKEVTSQAIANLHIIKNQN